MKRSGWIIALALTVLGPASQAADPTPELPAPTAPRGAPKVIELEAMVVEGKIQKPQVFYVLGRSRVEYESLKLQRTFVDRIVTSAKKSTF